MAEPTISAAKILYYGLQADYNDLQNKDSNILYFCTDSKKIFKGDVEMTEQVRFAAVKANVSAPVAGKLYIFADTGTVEVYNGSTWTVISYPILLTKNTQTGEPGITNASTDAQVPSAKAVYDYVQSIVGGDDVVVSVAESETEGAVDVTNGAGTTTTVYVHGAVTTPTYDATTRTFTFPIADDAEHPVVVELGTDIFIDPEANNRYEDGNIYLYLNDGTASTDPTELVIPVTSLVTDYFGDDTSTISVNIDNTTHKVTADVRVRPDSSVTGSEFTNLIKVSSATGAEGIYFDRTQLDANTSAIELLNAADSVTGSVAHAVKELADGQVALNTAAIEVLNGDSSTTGSVAKAVNDLATGAVADNTAAINLLNGDSSTTGSVAYAVKQVSDDVDALELRVQANEGAIEVLNGDATVTGSVAKAVNDLATGAVAQNTEAITVLNGDATVTGSVDQKIAALKNDYVDVNAANITVLSNAQGWGTF